jgi:drug/metabolite transporter (DMT)-like permease
LILLAMAFTSFNAAMARMGKWWYRLHRLVYLAVLAVMLHAFMIGTHASKSTLVVSLAFIAVTLLIMHSFVIIKQGKPVTKWQLAAIGGITAALVIVLSFGYSHRSAHQVSTVVTRLGGSNVQAY